MRAPISRGEMQLTPRAILARHLTVLHPPLSDHDRDQLLDAGLVEEDELVPDDRRLTPNAAEMLWKYVGHRWACKPTGGRPLLVRAADAPREPLTSVQEVESRFCSAVLLVELLSGGAMDDDSVAQLRWEPPWSISFAEAEKEDAERLVGEPHP